MPKDRGRNSQLARALSIIRDLDRVDGVDLYELAEKHGTDVRTIRRDLAGLEAVGLPIAEEPGDGKKKRWRLVYRDKLAKLADLVDISHYLALRVAMDTTRKKGSLFTSLEDLAVKMEKFLGRQERKQLEAIAEAFHSYEKFTYRENAPDIFWPIVTAIAARRMCEVIYRAPRVDAVDKSIRILPLRMFTFNQAVYLHAFVPKHREVIVLNLHRLRKLKLLDANMLPPKDYHPESLENSAFGVFVGKKEVTYRLRFSPEIAPYIRERSWHPSEKLRDLSDGGVELTFTCGESYEVTAWIASWREHVEVIEPQSLRDELRGFGTWLGKKYAH